MSTITSTEALESSGKQQRKGPSFHLLAPLFYAPVLPMIRITLRKRPVLRDRLFTLAVGTALIHGSIILGGLYDIENRHSST